MKGSGNFRSHDDSNLIYSRETGRWCDMQIFVAPWLCTKASCARDPGSGDVVCPQNLSDNGGCTGGPRSVTVRLSEDGVNFSGAIGCSDPPPEEKVKPTGEWRPFTRTARLCLLLRRRSFCVFSLVETVR